jgi:hypothetical protein
VKSQKSTAALAVLALAMAACATPTEPPEMPASEATTTLVDTVSTMTVEYVEVSGSALIQPQQVSIDTQGLPYGLRGPNLVPATPYDASQPPGPVGLPEHIEINFGSGMTEPWDPIMYIIPVDAYEQMWDMAGNPSVPATISQIYTKTVALPSPPPTSGMPALPPETVGGGVNDLAVQIGRTSPDPESATKSGYRFVGRWAQDANPVTNVGLRYVYQGFTNDGAYMVAFFYPVATAKLPADALSMEAADMEQFSADPQTYIQTQAEMLNALPTSDWAPDLATLDKLVASLRIEGMPVSGLHDATWQWTGSSYEGEDSPVADPTLYQVTYGPDGSLTVKADCTNASGTYTFEGGMVGSVRVTTDDAKPADCGTDSRSTELLYSVLAMNLTQDYRVPPGGGVLQLNMPGGGPVLSFEAVGMAQP